MIFLNQRDVSFSSVGCPQKDSFERTELYKVLLFFFFMEGERDGRRDVIFVIFAGTKLTKVFDKIFNVDPENSIISFLKVQLFS